MPFSLKEIMDPTATTCVACESEMPYGSQGGLCDACAEAEDAAARDLQKDFTAPDPDMSWDSRVDLGMNEGVEFDKFMKEILIKEGTGNKIVEVETPQRRYIKKFREFPNNRIKFNS